MTTITKEIVHKNFDVVHNFEYGASKGKAITDYAELWIEHKGIDRLERNINDPNEIIIAIVHFLTGTNLMHDYVFYVHNTDTGDRDEIKFYHTVEEQTIILETAFNFITNL